MEKDDLSYLLVSAVEETEEDKEKERQATATFVSADPDDYDEEGNYEGDDEYDDDLMYIEEPEYHIISEGLSMVNRYIHQIIKIQALPDIQQPLLSINDFSELMQALQDLRHETLPTRNLACDYESV